MESLQVLVMCTANVCRSPIAEQLMAQGFAEIGIDARFSSAGFLESGRAIHNRSAAALASRGIDASQHMSTQIRPDLIAAADLVVVMEADHLRRLVGEDHSCFDKVFTLRELATRISEVGARPDGESMADWLVRLNVGRAPQDFLGTTTHLDVSDPIRSGDDGFSQSVDEIALLVGAVVAGADGRLVGPPPAPVDPDARSGRRRFWSRR